MVPHAQDPADKQTFFVTNGEVTPESAEALVGSYRRRWGIETSYPVIGDVLPQSRSKHGSVRLFYFLFAVLLYDLWVLCNRLLTEVFGWERALPPISAAVFARLVRRRWMPDWFDQG